MPILIKSIKTKVQVKLCLLAFLAFYPIQFVSAINSDCAGKITPFIIGGDNASGFEFPFILSLQLASGDLCGAVLIKEDAALTAAHCVSTVPINQITLHAGNNRLDLDDPKEEKRVASEIIIHENYVDSVEGKLFVQNDLAILKVQKNFTLSPGVIETIKLPRLNYDFPERCGTVLGWGVTESANFSNILQKVSMPIHSKSICSRIYSRIGFNPSKEFCAGGDGKDTCGGDSGGAFVVRDGGEWVLYGIVSYGNDPCGELPGVYVQVSKYIPWIKKHIVADGESGTSSGDILSLFSNFLVRFIAESGRSSGNALSTFPIFILLFIRIVL